MGRQLTSQQELEFLLERGDGFLYNDFGGPHSSRGNVLHRSSCPHVRKSNLSIRKWSFDTELEAASWLNEERPASASGWTRCRFCLREGRTAPVSPSREPVITASPLPTLDRLRETVATYRAARMEFLGALGVNRSNRDPLAEFSERLVAAIVGGTLPRSSVQKGFDVVDPRGRRIQVKYVANPAGEWINGHTVTINDYLDDYALVIIEALDPRAVIVFQGDRLQEVAAALGKRHPNQDATLQLTRANVTALLEQPDRFASLGVRSAQSPDWTLP